jgi:hypothetical protein
LWHPTALPMTSSFTLSMSMCTSHT